MRSSLFIGGLLALFLIAPRSLPAQSNEQAVEAAKEAAQEWFVLLDADKYEATWEAAATLLKSKVTAEQWAAQVRRAHAALDSLRARSLVAARYTTNMPRAPEGEYVTAQYRATYGEKDAVETVSLKKDDGAWRVAGYYVKPGGQ
ncbi:DUF4019 domain-containing protein [Salinibacter ruber]|uniref:DUF4019 domain-containing protein n=1 Tax=Salinibacter ruber TaxID=146919 RepID=UPI001F078640|nr:DUF4019 domain-containing protein [Salinibacter ruber]